MDWASLYPAYAVEKQPQVQPQQPESEEAGEEARAGDVEMTDGGAAGEQPTQEQKVDHQAESGVVEKSIGQKRISKDVEIADIGCGFGGLLFALAPKLPETLLLDSWNFCFLCSFSPSLFDSRRGSTGFAFKRPLKAA